MTRYQRDSYKTNRGIWFMIGFGGVTVPFTILLQGRSFELGELVLYILVLALLPGMLFVDHHFGGAMISGRHLVLSRVLWTTTIPIQEIAILSYEARFNTLVLSVLHEANGAIHRDDLNVDFMNTRTLGALNDALLLINPTIEVRRDERSRKYQERNRNLHLKYPSTVRGRAVFAIKWLLLGSFAMSALLLAFAPRA